MTPIQFETTPILINDWIIIRLPEAVSTLLPSRGMGMIKGTINKIPFSTPIEPDGKFSHWFKVDDALQLKANIDIKQSVFLSIEPLDSWLEPDVPDDIMNSLILADLVTQWNSLTTKARWEWLRWIRSTKNPQTRQKRIEVTCSKLEAGKRRPCCFDQSRCTLTEVSKNGVLVD